MKKYIVSLMILFVMHGCCAMELVEVSSKKNSWYKDWDYKVDKNEDKYAYFVITNRKLSQCSFLCELCAIKHMRQIISKDVTNKIAYYSYLIEKSVAEEIIKNPRYSDLKNIFCIDDKDILFSNRASKQAWLYFEENENFKIKGDECFIKEMSQRFLQLSLHTRKKVKRYSENLLCKTYDQLSIVNTIWGKNENESNDIRYSLTKISIIPIMSFITSMICFCAIKITASLETKLGLGAAVIGSLSITAWESIKAISSNLITRPAFYEEMNTENVMLAVLGLGLKGSSISFLTGAGITIGGAAGIGLGLGVIVTECAGVRGRDIMYNLLGESEEARDCRLGFKRIALLKDEERS